MLAPEDMSSRRPLGLTLIAIGKLIKVTVLVVVGLATLRLLGSGDVDAQLVHWADAVRVDPGNRWFHHLLSSVAGLSHRRMEEVSLGTFVYAALFATEGLGLWFQKRWAEWFTIAITTSFVPLEVYELAHHPSVPKGVTLALNVLAVVYLVARVAARLRTPAPARVVARA